MQIIQGEIIEVIADEGMMLVNKEDNSMIAHHLWLGINDSPSNWLEVPNQEVKEDGTISEDNLFI